MEVNKETTSKDSICDFCNRDRNLEIKGASHSVLTNSVKKRSIGIKGTRHAYAYVYVLVKTGIKRFKFCFVMVVFNILVKLGFKINTPLIC